MEYGTIPIIKKTGRGIRGMQPNSILYTSSKLPKDSQRYICSEIYIDVRN